MYTYDLCILGGGPGGYEAAIEAAKLGKKVVVVEKDNLGGTCLLWGCIPTKALHHHAMLIHQLKKVNEKNIYNTTIDFSYKAIVEDKNRIVNELVDGIHGLFKKHKIDYYNSYGIIKNDHEVEVVNENKTISFETLLIATGSHPIVPNIKGKAHKKVITSTEMLNLEVLPKSLVIVGAGVIGLEFASIMNQFGVKVTIIEAMKSFLPQIDQSIVKRFKPLIKKQGVGIEFNARVEEISENGSDLKVTYRNKKDLEESVDAEYVLIAIGRGANLEGYGLDECSVDYTRKGIVVDDNFRTNKDNIFAIGDVNGRYQLAHAATAQGKSVVHKLYGDKQFNLSLVPSPIFTLPEMASVGKTEEKLKEENIAFKSFTKLYRANGKAKTLLEEDGIIKIIVEEESNIIIGVHILGERSSDMIHIGSLAIVNRMTMADLESQIFAHPTLSELYI